MKFVAFALSFAAVLAGCASGEAQVGRNQQSTSNTKAVSAVVPAAALSQSTMGSASGFVYFEQISSGSVSGLGFLSAASTKPTAFALHFNLGAKGIEGAAFFPMARGVAHLRKLPVGGYSVDYLDTYRFKRVTITTVPTRPVHLAGGTSGRWIGWVDESGQATLYFRDFNSSTTLDLGGESAQGLRIAESAGVAFVETKSGRTKVFSLSSLGAPRLEYDGVDAAVNPAGNRVAVVKTQNDHVGSVGIYDLSKPDAAPFYFDFGHPDGFAHEPSWRNGHELVYWVELPGGVKQLRVVDILTARQVTLATLRLDNVRSGIVCPTWNGDDLYFASFGKSAYSIYRARLNGGAWGVSAFAQTSESDEGYICPKVIGGN